MFEGPQTPGNLGVTCWTARITCPVIYNGFGRNTSGAAPKPPSCWSAGGRTAPDSRESNWVGNKRACDWRKAKVVET